MEVVETVSAGFKRDKKIKNPLNERVCEISFADWTGLEPATSAVTGRHSNQLNYQSNLRFWRSGEAFFAVATLVFRDGKDKRILIFSNKTFA